MWENRRKHEVISRKNPNHTRGFFLTGGRFLRSFLPRAIYNFFRMPGGKLFVFNPWFQAENIEYIIILYFRVENVT